MDFAKVEEFIRAHWPAAVIMCIIVIPSTWTIASIHYGERLTLLDAEVTDLTRKVTSLTERVAVLDQVASRKLEAVESRFVAAELYTPSPQLRVN